MTMEGFVHSEPATKEDQFPESVSAPGMLLGGAKSTSTSREIPSRPLSIASDSSWLVGNKPAYGWEPIHNTDSTLLDGGEPTGEPTDENNHRNDDKLADDESTDK